MTIFVSKKNKTINFIKILINEVYNNFPENFSYIKSNQSDIADVAFPVSENNVTDVSLILYSNPNNKLKKRDVFYEITGLSLLNNKSKNNDNIVLFVGNDGIHNISIKNEVKNFNTYLPLKLTKDNLDIIERKYVNEDKPVLLKLLKNINKNQIDKLEIEGSFEIEDDDKILYTIVDMEDGNYIAVDKSLMVYRLDHNADELTKKIFENINDFLTNYSGKKQDLENYF